MITTQQLGANILRVRMAAHRGPFPTQALYTKAISDYLREHGIPHAPAKYDDKGNCLTCGECGRCPGVHTFEEIQQAARKAAAFNLVCPVDEEKCDGCAGVRPPCSDAAPASDPCDGCRRVGVVNCIECIKKDKEV